MKVEPSFGIALTESAAPLFKPGARLETLHTGMEWAEGPVYFAEGDRLLFSDIPNHQLLEWSPETGVRVFEAQSNFTNGNTIDHAGQRISCEHLTNSVVRFGEEGGRDVLASLYDGRRLNSPNDVVVASDGAVWFTDPSYGIMSEREGQPRASEQDACRVYRIDPVSRACEAVCDTLKMPNGLAFSADEKTLYVADSSRSHFADGYHHLFAFDVVGGRRLENQRVFHEIETGVPDGLRVDTEDNIWCSSGRGIEILTRDGVLIGHIPVPEVVANLTFGGADGTRLFITATTSLYAIDVQAKGATAALVKRRYNGKAIHGRIYDDRRETD